MTLKSTMILILTILGSVLLTIGGSILFIGLSDLGFINDSEFQQFKKALQVTGGFGLGMGSIMLLTSLVLARRKF